jgi:DNA-binding Lrp family transcriptional regulator
VAKLPAFQFYPGDWQQDAALRACSVGARGCWIEMICVMHQADPYGHLLLNGKPISVAVLARLIGASEKETSKWLNELEDAGVFTRSEDGCIMSRRMVRDEELRDARRIGGYKGAKHGTKGSDFGSLGGRPTSQEKPPSYPPLKPPSPTRNKPPLNPPPSSSSSSSSSSSITLSHSHARAGFESVGFATVWDRWRKHLREQQKPLTDTTEESQVMALSQVAENEVDAIAIVEFSITKQAKNLILSGDHRPQSLPDRITTTPSRYTKQPPKIPQLTEADCQ